MQDRCVGAVVLGTVEKEALPRGANHEVAAASQQSAALRQGIRHAVADHEVPPWSRAPVIDESLQRVDAAKNEGHVWPHGAMEEGDVLDCFAVRPHLGVDLAAPAEDRYRLQVRLAVDPVRPQPAIRLEEAEADIRNSADPGFHELVVDSNRSSLLDDLIPATGRPPH